MDCPDQYLTVWLRAHYDQIETAAGEAGADDVPTWRIHDGRIIGADPRFDSVIIDRSPEPTTCQRIHIALHDPTTVLADLDAKRAIIDIVTEDETAEGQCRAARVIRALAAALAHHPDLPPRATQATAQQPAE